jgi:hypothetical protein
LTGFACGETGTAQRFPVTTDEGGTVRTRPIRQVVANAVAVIAVLGIVFGAVAACGSAG